MPADSGEELALTLALVDATVAKENLGTDIRSAGGNRLVLRFYCRD